MTDDAQSRSSPISSEGLESLLNRRHSCRRFLSTPIEQSDIETILRLAQKTASWCNTQPWKVTILLGDAIERFRDLMSAEALQGKVVPDIPFPERYDGVYAERRRECGLQLYQSLGIGKEDLEGRIRQALENFHLFGAPHLAIVTTEASLGTYGAIDCGAYISNFMLAAASLGVATIAQASLASHSNVIRALLRLPVERTVMTGISFGYTDEQHPANGFRTSRAAIETVATFVSDGL